MAIDLRPMPEDKQRYDICLESVKADGTLQLTKEDIAFMLDFTSV